MSVKRRESYLNNDPFRRRGRVHDGDKEGPKLLDNLARNLEEERQGAPGQPFRDRREGIETNVRIANEVRVS